MTMMEGVDDMKSNTDEEESEDKTDCEGGVQGRGEDMENDDGIKSMVEKLFTNNIIKSQEVLSVMKQVDRGNYVRHNPYMDSRQYIGYINIAAPHMHAHALELLSDHLKPGMQGLDVGSRTGYLTASMDLMVGDQG